LGTLDPRQRVMRNQPWALVTTSLEISKSGIFASGGQFFAPQFHFAKTLCTSKSGSYTEPVSGFLRIVGIVNAAIWFGATIFFAVGILPAVFSQELYTLFRETADAPFYSGAVAQLLFQRFFELQCVCGLVALFHLLAEKLYLGRALPRFGTGLVVGLFCFALIGNYLLQPHMKDLRQTRYFGRTQEQKERAKHSFAVWHVLSEIANLFVLGGLLVHLVRVTRPSGPVRHGTFYQIP
jgi:hypothetical protein